MAGSLGAGQRAAVGDALAGQNAHKAVGDALVLAEQVADLAAAHADITGGHVAVRADVTVQLGHEALAETHDLGVALAVGVKVAAALAAAHGQTGQAVLEDLLETKELDDRQVDALVETQAALVGTDGRVELNTVAAVDLDLAVVIHPGHAEHDDALRLYNALNQAVFLQLRAGLNDRLQAFQNFIHRLQEFLLLSVARGQALIHTGQVSVLDRHSNTLSLFRRCTFPLMGAAPHLICYLLTPVSMLPPDRALRKRKSQKMSVFLLRLCALQGQCAAARQKR